MIFFHENDSRLNSLIIHKSVRQVPIKKYGLITLFLLFNILEIEKVLLKVGEIRLTPAHFAV